MTTRTKTRDEAIEEVKRQIEIQQENAGLCGQLEYTDREVFARCFKGGKFFNVVEEFTPPKPEFEKGTFGRTDNGNLIELTQFHINSGVGFTPIYQTDPIEKLAFELACESLYSHPEHKIEGAEISDRHCSKYTHTQILKAHFKSKAKEELSK